MLDITYKTGSLRRALAEATVKVAPVTVACIREQRIPKGDPLPVARVAAIQAAKNTSQIIPYCHPIGLDFVGVDFQLYDDTIVIATSVKAVQKTGVEMEALTAASVAALTLYDMLKGIDSSVEIIRIRLVEKHGGRSDYGRVTHPPLQAVVLVISDRIVTGQCHDVSGSIITERLQQEGFALADYRVVPDEFSVIVDALVEYSDEWHVNLILTTGGTGFGERDNTPEATLQVVEREAPGVAEALRSYGQMRMPYAMLSRGRAGIRGSTVIINLPGGTRAVTESLDALFPGIWHSFTMLRGEPHQEEIREHGPEGRDTL